MKQGNSYSYSQFQNVAGFLHVIGNPLRLEILFCLLEGPKCVCDLTALLHRRQACVSQHLMQLRQHGLVTSHRQGCNRYYVIHSESLKHYLRCILNNWKDDLFLMDKTKDHAHLPSV